LRNGTKCVALLLAAKKGGVGKSSLAAHLGTAAATDGMRVLIIDTDVADEQMNCVRWAERRRLLGGSSGPKVVKAVIGKARDAIAWGRSKGYQLIIVDTAAGDFVRMVELAEVVDFLLTPAQPSENDMEGTLPLRRVWDNTSTPRAIVINGANRPDSPRTRYYANKYAELGPTLPVVLTRRTDYIDALANGLGVSEYNPGSTADIEIRSLLAEILRRASARKRATQ
jgi:chromosome partitioning protein